jgi:CheY-like chemotaxis protein
MQKNWRRRTTFKWLNLYLIMKSVLFIDDDEDDKLVFGHALSAVDQNILYLTASDGQEALKILKDELIILPDVIFMDLNMPKMDGFTCLDHIKKMEDLKEIPVLILSTSTNPRDMERAKSLGAQKFITKPSTYSGLVEALKTTISY